MVARASAYFSVCFVQENKWGGKKKKKKKRKGGGSRWRCICLRTLAGCHQTFPCWCHRRVRVGIDRKMLPRGGGFIQEEQPVSITEATAPGVAGVGCFPSLSRAR